MSNLEDDPIIGRYFNTPEKKAQWLFRIKIFYILWIVFMIIGIIFLLFWYFFK